jgi:hypothetical protein
VGSGSPAAACDGRHQDIAGRDHHGPRMGIDHGATGTDDRRRNGCRRTWTYHRTVSLSGYFSLCSEAVDGHSCTIVWVACSEVWRVGILEMMAAGGHSSLEAHGC